MVWQESGGRSAFVEVGAGGAGALDEERRSRGRVWIGVSFS